MTQGDWLTIIAAILPAGGGAYMATLKRRTTRRIGIGLMGLGAAAFLVWFGHYELSPGAQAQQQPSVSIQGDCNVGIGNNNKPCSPTIYAPPRHINALYDASTELGVVDGQIILSDDRKHLMFDRMKYYDGFPWGKTITLQTKDGAQLISCPQRQDCPPGFMCMKGQDNLSGQMMNNLAPAICNLE